MTLISKKWVLKMLIKKTNTEERNPTLNVLTAEYKDAGLRVPARGLCNTSTATTMVSS